MVTKREPTGTLRLMQLSAETGSPHGTATRSQLRGTEFMEQAPVTDLVGLFNSYMKCNERRASRPPSMIPLTFSTSSKRKMLVEKDRRRANIPGVQWMRLAFSRKLPSRT